MTKRPTSRQLAITCARACDEKKADEIVILDLRKLSFLTDFFVIATTQSERQARAILEGMRKDFKAKGVRALNANGTSDGKWSLIDFGDVVLHLFLGEQREFFDLESLWADAARISWKTRNTRVKKKA